MKLFFISDLHGSSTWVNRALKKFEEEKAEIIVLLGDVLYHGPRNPLPEAYDPPKVAQSLNQYKDKIISVRGNCDAEVDQMMLEFPMLSDYTVIFHEGIRIFATHGHLYEIEKVQWLSKGDVFIQGHTHILDGKKVEEKTFLNPGSISLPKEGNPHTYGILENKTFIVKDFEGQIIKECTL